MIIVSFTIDVILWFWQLILLLKFMATGIEQSAAEEPPETEDE